MCIFLWKFEHQILPTQCLLSSRIIRPNFTVTCKWCGLQDESFGHLFFQCELAKWSWELLSTWCDWPGINASNHSLHYLFSNKPKDICSKIWHVFIASVMWSIWLSRNELVFNNTRIKQVDFNALIKLRLFKWLEVLKEVNSNVATLWNVNPSGALQLCLMENKSNFWSCLYKKYKLIYASDGSRTRISPVVATAGIGGLIKDYKANTLYIFSGPVSEVDILKVEMQALEYLINLVSQIQLIDSPVCFCSDSTEANSCMKKKWIFGDLKNLFPPSIKVDFLHIPRNFNLEADMLAKQGAKRSSLIGAWI